MDDSYLKEFTAKIEEVNGNIILLSDTAFYPTGGGVPCDFGWIIKNEKRFDVINVTKADGKIFHHLTDASGLSFGDTITGLIDWNRRYALMKYHTSAHLVAALLYNETKALITGGQIGIDVSRMDFSLENFDKALIEDVIKKANEEIRNDKTVKIYYIDKNEIDKIPGVVKLAHAAPPDEEKLRIVEIEGIDIQADGGCHVRSLKEIGKIELVKAENKGKNNRRLYWKII